MVELGFKTSLPASRVNIGNYCLIVLLVSPKVLFAFTQLCLPRRMGFDFFHWQARCIRDAIVYFPCSCCPSPFISLCLFHHLFSLHAIHSFIHSSNIYWASSQQFPKYSKKTKFLSQGHSIKGYSWQISKKKKRCVYVWCVCVYYIEWFKKNSNTMIFE